jgi:hypothetical protein
MININVNSTKEITVTLYEKCSNITNPYFTWMIQNKTTQQQTIFYADDHSNSPYYYNSFTFSISSTQSGLTAGIINVPGGQYNYFVYEMQNPYDLNLNNAINLVELGIMQIVPTYSTIVNVLDSISLTYSAYQGLDRI